jgi:ABC-type Fe3+ transport system substrate-binding protein
MRSSTNIYNLSLLGAMIDHLGEQKAETWAQGVRTNLAVEPKGGDTDQLKNVAAGQCDVTISNQYYYARLLRSQKPDERQVGERVGIVFPNQKSWGTHVNISGAGVMKHAPNREAAVRFLEYLASDEAQRYFADGNGGSAPRAAHAGAHQRLLRLPRREPPGAAARPPARPAPWHRHSPQPDQKNSAATARRRPRGETIHSGRSGAARSPGRARPLAARKGWRHGEKALVCAA